MSSVRVATSSPCPRFGPQQGPDALAAPTRHGFPSPLLAEAFGDLQPSAGFVIRPRPPGDRRPEHLGDRKSTRLNSSHPSISYAVFCLKKKKQHQKPTEQKKNSQKHICHRRREIAY